MALKRYLATQDNTITNAFKPNMMSRMTGSNNGASDVLEVFHTYAQANSSSHEVSRILVQWSINDIISDRSASKIPSSGSVSFFVRLFNTPHSQTLPRNYTLFISPVSRSWQEGIGKDLDEGTDLTYNRLGSDWINASSGSTWTSQGGDYLTGTFLASQNFPTGSEDLEIDVSSLVESWIAGTIQNNGIGVFLSSSLESGSASYYTKRFFARTSEYFFKRPIIEARWNNSIKDKRGKVIVSSSLLNATNNLNTIYLYNYFDGSLTDIPNIVQGNTIYVHFFTSASGGEQILTTPTPITGGWYSTGVYTASFAINTTASLLYDRWFSGSNVYFTGSFEPKVHVGGGNVSITNNNVIKITNFKPSYNVNENVRFRLFTRQKGWNPHIYTVATQELPTQIIENVYYKVMRLTDNIDVISYGTGSRNHTLLSYDVSGSYFDFDMNILEPGYMYAFKFLVLANGQYQEQNETFKFKVDDAVF